MDAARIALFIIATGGLLLCASCGFQLEGEDGKLLFEFDAPDTPYTLDTSLAVGTRQRIIVKPKDSKDRALGSPDALLESVISSDPGVISVESVEQDSFVLEAHTPGDVTLSVTSNVLNRDQAITDSLTLSAATATSVRVSHGCTFEEAPAYLTDTTVDLRYRLLNGYTRLLGYGYYPVKAEDENDARIVRDVSKVGVLRIHTSHESGTFQLIAENGGVLLELVKVDQGQITSVNVGRLQRVALKNEVNFRPELLATNRRLCQALPTAEVSTDTPDVCSPRIVEDEASHSRLRINVALLAPGTCEWSLSLPNARHGEGLEKSYSFNTSQTH